MHYCNGETMLTSAGQTFFDGDGEIDKCPCLVSSVPRQLLMGLCVANEPFGGWMGADCGKAGRTRVDAGNLLARALLSQSHQSPLSRVPRMQARREVALTGEAMQGMFFGERRCSVGGFAYPEPWHRPLSTLMATSYIPSAASAVPGSTHSKFHPLRTVSLGTPILPATGPRWTRLSSTEPSR
jgi:hypothetical protein